MNRECRWCRAGPINVQKRYLFRGTRKGACTVLAPRCDDQASLGEFRERFPHEGGIRFHAFGEGRRRDFLSVKKTKRCHNVRCYRELNACGGHRNLLAAYVMLTSTIRIQAFFQLRQKGAFVQAFIPPSTVRFAPVTYE